MSIAPAPISTQSFIGGRDALSEHGVVASVRMAPLNPTQEYVASGRLNAQVSRDTAEILAANADEILRWLGPRAYDRMELDAEVSKCLTVLKTYTLSDGLTIAPAVPEQDKVRFKNAKWLSDFVTRAVNNNSVSIRDVLEQMLDSMKYGHKVAEITFDFRETGDDKNLYYLKHLKVLKQASVAFVRDRFKNVLGFKVPTLDSQNKLKIIPREKFFVITFRGKDADPRGTSILKSAYHAWHFKMMMWPEYLTWLKQCAVPGLVGITSLENDNKNYVRDSSGAPVKDSQGNFITVPSTSQLADALAQMRNASAIAIPAGSQVLPINNSVSSEPFKTSRDVANEEIEMTLLLQTLATSDSRHNTRAASQTAMTVLDILVFDIKGIVAEAFRRDVVKQLIMTNSEELQRRLKLTEEELLQLIPKVSMGDTERRMWSTEGLAAATMYSSGLLRESQLPAIYDQLGIEQPAQGDTEPNKALQLAKQPAQLAKQPAIPSSGDVKGSPVTKPTTGGVNG